MKRIWLPAWLGVSVLWAMSVCLPSEGRAADVSIPTKTVAAPSPALDAWAFTLASYVWMPSLNGSTTVKGRTIDVDVTFIDILDHTEILNDLFGIMTYFEARNGRFFGDIVYLKIGLNGDTTQSRGTDDLNASVGASAGLKLEMVIAQLAAAYELAKWPSTSGPGSNTAIDLYCGVRGWWQKADASVDLGGTVNVGDLARTADWTLTASGDVTWLDRRRERSGPYGGLLRG